jgi:hypothetical protein
MLGHCHGFAMISIWYLKAIAEKDSKTDLYSA